MARRKAASPLDEARRGESRASLPQFLIRTRKNDRHTAHAGLSPGGWWLFLPTRIEDFTGKWPLSATPHADARSLVWGPIFLPREHHPSHFSFFLSSRARGQKLNTGSFLALKKLEILFAYDMELNCLRIRATNQKHILILLRTRKVGDRITLFHEGPMKAPSSVR